MREWGGEDQWETWKNEETTTNCFYGFEGCEGPKRDAGIGKMIGGELLSQGWKLYGLDVSATTLRTATWRDGYGRVIEIAGS